MLFLLTKRDLDENKVWSQSRGDVSYPTQNLNFEYENVDGYSIQNTSKNFDSENVDEGRGELNHPHHFSFDASAIEDPCCSLIES